MLVHARINCQPLVYCVCGLAASLLWKERKRRTNKTVLSGGVYQTADEMTCPGLGAISHELGLVIAKWTADHPPGWQQPFQGINRLMSPVDSGRAVIGIMLPIIAVWGRHNEQALCRAIALFDRYVGATGTAVPFSGAMPSPGMTHDLSQPPNRVVVEIALVVTRRALQMEETAEDAPSMFDLLHDSEYYWQAKYADMAGQVAGVSAKDLAARDWDVLRVLDYKLDRPTLFDMVVLADCMAWRTLQHQFGSGDRNTLRALTGQLVLLSAMDSLARTAVSDPWVTGAAIVAMVYAISTGGVGIGQLLTNRLGPLIASAEDTLKVEAAANRIAGRADALHISLAEFMHRYTYGTFVRPMLIRSRDAKEPEAFMRPEWTLGHLAVLEAFISSTPIMTRTMMQQRRRKRK